MFECAARIDWSPAFGDRGLLAWVTVAAYLAACALAVAVFWQSSEHRHGGAYRRQRFFWFMLSLLLLVLAINKQLDLQTLLTAIGRCDAIAEGWYDARRGVQQTFIYAMIIGIGAAILLSAVFLIGLRACNYLAVLGIAALAAYVLLRAAYHYHVDAMIPVAEMIMARNWMIELGGITLIVASAILLLAQPERAG